MTAPRKSRSGPGSRGKTPPRAASRARDRTRIQDVRFVLGAARVDQFPGWDIPEIAFGGRSNVGKSSLLRTLLGSKRLVRVSRTPGRTREVNFFSLSLGGWPCAFVDLPGYGYARVPQAVKRRFQDTVDAYVAQRPQLRAMVLLLDARREPGEDERSLMEFLAERSVALLPVFTKVDKLPKNVRINLLRRHQRALGQGAGGRPLGFSALTGEGRDDVLARLAGWAEPSGPAGRDAPADGQELVPEDPGSKGDREKT